MAQYGRNYYGASYYGLNSVFAGQFMSDPINLNTPLTNIAPSDGKLHADIICTHPKVTYPHSENIFLRSGQWTIDGTTVHSSDPAMSMTISLTASTLAINYISRVDGATIDVEVKTYIGGVLAETNTYTVDTMGPSPFVINPSQFGEQVVKITKNASSGAAEIFELASITAVTTDVKLEMRAKNPDNSWGGWEQVALTATDSDISYNGFSNVYKYASSTGDWNGKTGYQFKLMMASSDNTNSPEIISVDVHTTSTNDYSTSGYWKTTIYIPEAINSVNSVTFNATEPAGTKVEVRTRTSDIDGNWSSWSVPYSAALNRAVLNYKVNPSITSGYVITPLISPENLTTWQKLLTTHFINDIDTFSRANTPGSSITIEVVNANYNPLTPSASHVLKTFTIKTPDSLSAALGDISIPVRIKVNLIRTTANASPAVEVVNLISNAYYKELKVFGTGESDFKGYGSAVYGQNTGIDKVYLDGISRTAEAKISSLGFTVPVGAANPEYVIEIDPSFAEQYTAEEISVYWNSNSSSSVVTSGALTDDTLMVNVKEAKEKKKVRKHYRYGSGIVLTLAPESVKINLTSTFSPALLPTTNYAYYVQNGFTFDAPNTNVDIRWSSEDLLASESRRDITYTLNDQICISIVTGNRNGVVAWKSEEMKFSCLVNSNDSYGKYVGVITNLPEIEPGVILNPDASAIPYKVEVIEGSVTSYGQRKPESNIQGSVRYLYSTEQTPSLVQAVEEKIEVVRGSSNKDYLPKALVKSIIGIYSQANQYSAYYQNSVDYTYSIPTGSTYSNEIDWSLGILGADGAKAPAEGETYYVSYTYDKVVSLRVEFLCDYSEYRPLAQIYRSPAIEYTGECSPMFDYISGPISTGSFTVPSDVDKSTLRLVVYDDNPRVRTYIYNGKVVGTLDKRDPRESWNPYVRGGHYYIGKNSYYMFTNEVVKSLGSDTIPIAENVVYSGGANGSGALIQEGTTNILSNTTFSVSDVMVDSFTDTFTRA